VSYTTPNSTNFTAVRPFRSNVDPADFNDASQLTERLGAPNTAQSFTETGLPADDYHYWLEPINGSGVPGPREGPFTVTVA